MKVRLYFTAEGNSDPSYLRELTLYGIELSNMPQFVYTREQGSVISHGTTDTPPAEGVKSHPSEKFYKYSKKLSSDNACACYLEMKY